MQNELLIIGAGPAGISLAARLSSYGIQFDWIEKSNTIAPLWHNNYDRLKLNTVKRYSNLPFLEMPVEYPKYVSSKQLVAYLEDYCNKFKIKPQFNSVAKLITPKDNGYQVDINNESCWYKKVVLCGGLNNEFNEVKIKNQALYTGEIIHCRQYKNGSKYAGCNVLVIGMGNTGAEIALDLYEHGAKPFISIKEGVNIVPRDFLGRSIQESAILLNFLPDRVNYFISKIAQRLFIGDLSKYGIPTPKLAPGEALKLLRRTPVLDTGTVAKIKEGKILIINQVAEFTEHGILTIDDRHLNFEAVIMATGYKTGLRKLMPDLIPYMNRNDYLDEFKIPPFPNLYFLGYLNALEGAFYRINIDSGIVAEDIKNNL